LDQKNIKPLTQSLLRILSADHSTVTVGNLFIFKPQGHSHDSYERFF